MDPIIARIAHNMVERVTGPMKFRLLLQPAMATFFAIRGGLQDAKECKPPYFWGLFTDKGEREAMLKNGWKSVGKVFILAIVLDVVYQLIEHRWTVYPGEAVLVAIILAIVPYLLIRGPVNRIVCEKRKASQGTIGRRLDPYVNQLPDRTLSEWPRPSHNEPLRITRVRLTGRSPRLLPGQGRQPQRNILNQKGINHG